MCRRATSAIPRGVAGAGVGRTERRATLVFELVEGILVLRVATPTLHDGASVRRLDLPEHGHGALGVLGRRAVRIVNTAATEVPATLGWLKPMVLLPISAFTVLTP